MTTYFIVCCTCANAVEAQRIATVLVEERLAACANIFPSICSIYRWEGKVESAEEWLLFIKSAEPHYPRLRDRITELHSYDTPEIIALPIIAGSEKYLSWLRGQL
ncbi:MAG: divalent-cation tolerance protein CutA [Acidobacteriaceae bacterium]|nr:divalent-cation tolerance protein CutA [Acidobacteriaceae bacterium]MBV9038792.1 divalent-cation tolerance protein CutA [Acidobacteriaceae bacterium]MBV9222663.1 divalent-cation tolerance protein CutA [Acidobacteriaceae bacterium]MBV9675314.1 divalent-cation tolerance protein CutA [Acidobacteriaceae bacterium]MBV9939451.1 divalent-cation tolerance protein CutA [Acidobacteriaceae bacterium]